MRSTCPLNNRFSGEVAENTANLMLDEPPLTVRVNGAFSATELVSILISPVL
jgi:hypothetical protein